MSNNATSNNAGQPLGGTAIKPVGWDRTGWEAFRYMLYDPDTGKVLTRTPLSWLKIFVFYCIYYSCLAAFWLACLQVFFLTVPTDHPKWTLEDSIIGVNPGVGMKPPMSDKRIDSSLYEFSLEDSSTTPTNKEGEGEKNIDLKTRMDLFMAKYNNNSGLNDCTDNNDSNKGKCIFDMSTLGECNSENNYGYLPVGADKTIEPCFFLKLNKIYGFNPEPITEADFADYPEMDEEFKGKIKDAKEPAVFFNCFGRFPADMEAAKFNFFPEDQAVSLKYFPFKGGNYQSPMVAVKVSAAEGQLVHIECRAYYKGVVHDKKDKMGLIQFEVLIN
eukprot:TRINITY_DN9156_c0_g1_i6.p1 TRINITY_DN9156_c0_g1~~TRINITY_DN9156_c0_g1_i6.p1  ORF type:complete len:330 (-),score=128.39 TRINITY_DN9156_c0_g1_i6:402-1391(-)